MQLKTPSQFVNNFLQQFGYAFSSSDSCGVILRFSPRSLPIHF
jgi:hypothetical protein